MFHLAWSPHHYVLHYIRKQCCSLDHSQLATMSNTFHFTCSLESSNLSKTVTFRMTDFLKHKSDKDLFYSPPFYTSHTTGYKMCLWIDADGWDDGDGTHVSVSYHLMKGDNDDSLSWPFTGRVTIEILNQLEDDNHYKEMNPFKTGTRRVVGGETAKFGGGWAQFISHADLDYDAKTNTQYLKDDTLVFRVSVKIPNYKPWLEPTI